jgi:hypothetical protein
MGKLIRVWDGTAWQEITPALPYTSKHSAQPTIPANPQDGEIWLDTDGTVVDISAYAPPTIGSTLIPSGTTVSTISGLTLSSPVLGSATGTSLGLTVASGTTVPLTISNLGTGKSFVVEDETNPDASPFVIAADGKVGIGVSNPTGNPLEVGSNNFGVRVTRYSATSFAGSGIDLRKSSSGTVGTDGAVINGDRLGRVLYTGYDGATYITGAEIGSDVDGTVSTGIVPTRIFFNTMSTSGVNAERMRIDSAGNVGVGTTSPIAPMHLAGTSSPMMIFDYYASNTNSSLFLGRKARGTITSPTAVLSGDSIAAVAARGYGATAFSSASNGLIAFWAAENFTDAAQGTYITFETVPIGSTSRAERMRIDGSGNTTINAIADATTTTAARGAGYMGVPQSAAATTGAYTIVAADAGEHIYSTATRTITIPANGSVGFPVGTAITFIAATGTTVTIAITTDTLLLAGSGTTGNRTLAPFGMATAIKITSTSWIISGNGLS